MLIVLSCILLFLLYSLLIIYFTRSWNAVPDFTSRESEPVRFTVIIPARNEALRIGALLTALQRQSHPDAYTEIIVADDESTDDTASIVRGFPGVKLLSVKHQPGETAHKKAAIAAAIAIAGGDYIAGTDADCIPGPEWLSTLSSFIMQQGAAFVAAPVQYNSGNKWSDIFQSLDFMTLQGITGAVVSRGTLAMSNGANLAYSKKAFGEVNGFEGIGHIASGDDMLLMQKIRDKWPDKVRYLKSADAIVHTAPMPGWRAFINQRIRWASKATAYTDPKIKAILLLVYLFNLSLVVLAIAAIFQPSLVYWLAGFWIAKTLTELPFLYAVAGFFGERRLLVYFLFFQPLHIGYTVLSGFFGLWKKYEWKGRIVR